MNEINNLIQKIRCNGDYQWLVQNNQRLAYAQLIEYLKALFLTCLPKQQLAQWKTVVLDFEMLQQSIVLPTYPLYFIHQDLKLMIYLGCRTEAMIASSDDWIRFHREDYHDDDWLNIAPIQYWYTALSILIDPLHPAQVVKMVGVLQDILAADSETSSYETIVAAVQVKNINQDI